MYVTSYQKTTFVILYFILSYKYQLFKKTDAVTQLLDSMLHHRIFITSHLLHVILIPTFFQHWTGRQYSSTKNR